MSIRDKSRVLALLKELELIEKKSLQIGIFGEDDSQILMIARVHEFGVQIKVTDKMRGYLSAVKDIHLRADTTHINIPERSYIRAGFDFNRNKFMQQGKVLIERVIEGKITAHKMFELLGEYLSGAIKQYVTNLSNPPLSNVTIENKGSSNPLIDTGRMRDSITYKVVG